jgi:hypothetical protein
MELTKLLIRTVLKLTIVVALFVVGWAQHGRDGGVLLALIFWLAAGCALTSLFYDLRPASTTQKRVKLDKDAA